MLLHLQEDSDEEHDRQDHVAARQGLRVNAIRFTHLNIKAKSV